MIKEGLHLSLGSETNVIEFLVILHLTVCSCHVTYAFQSESTLYICLNVVVVGSSPVAVDAYPVLDISDIACHLEYTKIGVSWLHRAS